jgi:UMF1 family MFS transporter
MKETKDNKSALLAWIGYDFINSLVIINGSLYFSRWIILDQGAGSFWYGFTFFVSTLVLLIISPIAGAIIDRRRNGLSLLAYLSFSLGVFAITLTNLGGYPQHWVRLGGTLVTFGLINVVYQLSLVPYNWLLPQMRGVLDLRDVTRYTGWGEAAGCVGSVVGALLGRQLLITWLGETPGGRLALQGVMGWIFILLLVPVFIVLVRGTERVAVAARSYAATESGLRVYIRDNVRLARQRPRLTRYLIAFMLYADALLTVQLFLPIYLREHVGFGDSATSIAFAVALSAAAIASSIVGWVRPRRLRLVISVSLALWLGAFVSLAYATTNGILIWSTLVTSGILFGVLWTASRAYLFELTEQATLGKGYGLYSVFERCASLLGPLCWGVVMLLPYSMRVRYSIAFGVMGLLILLGILLLLDVGATVIDERLALKE